MTGDRRFNLTQGEIPALFGEHPGGLTMADLRARKRGEVEDPDLAPGRLFWEAHHAEWSARGVAEREGWVTQAKGWHPPIVYRACGDPSTYAS